MSGSKSVAVPEAPGIAARAAGGGAGAVNRAGCQAVRDLGQDPAPVPILSSHQKRGVSMADDWPLRSYLELGALPGAVPCARLHARQVLWEWGITELGEQVELLTSELTTNAVRGSRALEPATPIRLWLLSDKAHVVILVWDGNPLPPVRAEVGEDAESGRGLVIVEAISEEWGWYPDGDLGGKWVWCRVAGNDQTAARPASRDAAQGA